MGIDRSIYIGPFFLCQNIQRDTEIKEKRCNQCNNKSYEAFCSRCGGVIVTTTSIVKQDICWAVVNEELKQKLFYIDKENLKTIQIDGKILTDFAIWAPNIPWNHKNPNSLEDYNQPDGKRSIIMDKDYIDAISKDIMQFITSFADCELILDKFYDKENVSVRYGIIPWSS